MMNDPHSTTAPRGSAQRMKRTALVLFALLLAAFGPAAQAQSLSGVNGLVTVPTAEVSPDATLTTGFNVLNRSALDYHAGRHHATSPYLSLAYLPFLEVGFRLTRADSEIEEAFGDRTVNARVLLLGEGPRHPSLLVGIHDFVGQKRHFQSTYVVASKRLEDVPHLDHVSLHVGYGTRLLDAELYEFAGPFGGIAVAPSSNVRLLAEYTSSRVNVGLDAGPFRGMRILVGWMDFRAVSGGVSYSFVLPK